MSDLIEPGWGVIPSRRSLELLAPWRDTHFTSDLAGSRCLLDQPGVHQTAVRLHLAECDASTGSLRV